VQNFNLPYLQKINDVITTKTSISDKVVLTILVLFFVWGSFLPLRDVYYESTVEIPASGGSFTEGIIGTPRFINPLLSFSDSDRDIITLVYSGLMRAGAHGSLVPDLAKSYTISDDGKVYSFTLKDNLTFHDGNKLTVDDIIFTIEMSQNSLLKSNKRADWDGVKIEKIDDKNITFTLKKPYAPFLENMTLGILPSHLWKEVGIQEFSFSKLNTNPIGSGPYKIDTVLHNDANIPSSYILKPFKDYALGKPYISKITLLFYSDEKALSQAWETREIDSISSISADSLLGTTRNAELLRITFPRIFAVFFNQSKSKIFADESVRHALDTAINKQLIIDSVLGGYATTLHSPIPTDIFKSINNQEEELVESDRIEKSRKILEDNDWIFNEETQVWEKDKLSLNFSIATANTPELKQAANLVAKQWRAIGANVEVNTYNTGELNQSIIRTRDYDALLFGEVIGRSLDLFAFWHSSQRDDPGLNIAGYANAKVDKLLEEARSTSDDKKREVTYKKISDLISGDYPASFLYSPDFIYIIPEGMQNVNMDMVSTPSERFANIHNWYLETNRVWTFFAK